MKIVYLLLCVFCITGCGSDRDKTIELVECTTCQDEKCKSELLSEAGIGSRYDISKDKILRYHKDENGRVSVNDIAKNNDCSVMPKAGFAFDCRNDKADTSQNGNLITTFSNKFETTYDGSSTLRISSYWATTLVAFDKNGRSRTKTISSEKHTTTCKVK